MESMSRKMMRYGIFLFLPGTNKTLSKAAHAIAVR